ncbi:MAG: hypothetical protein V4850_37210 [Myxococcota bacterium]
METSPITDAFAPVRALRHGADALQRAPVGLLVGGALLLLLDTCAGSGGNQGDLAEVTQHLDEAQARLVVGFAWLLTVVAIASFFLRCWLLPGWLRLHRHVLQTGQDALGTLFGGGDVFLRMLGWQILNKVILLGTFVVAALPGGALMALGAAQENDILGAVGALLLIVLALPVLVYVWLGLVLGDFAVALENLGPVATLDRTWELARGNRLRLGVFFGVMELFSLLGVLLCCVGVFLTRPIAQIGATEAYLLATVPGAKDWVVPGEAP